jgi:hypothetical protein
MPVIDERPEKQSFGERMAHAHKMRDEAESMERSVYENLLAHIENHCAVMRELGWHADFRVSKFEFRNQPEPEDSAAYHTAQDYSSRDYSGRAAVRASNVEPMPRDGR